MKYRLDELLGRLTMYRVALFGLLAVYVTGLILSVSGSLAFTPQAMLASAVVLLVTTYVSNRVFGWLHGVQPHGESSVITALILFFLFMPVSDSVGLVNIAFVAVIASASKYLLAIRGRHIFNPVAVAAVAGGLSGIVFATWWVATPTLLPVTLVAAFAVLYKTRRITLGAVFLLIAIPLIVIHAQLGGQPLSVALGGLGSWPLIFFVGFMLSEPLTLPPRRWQQLLVAGMVAVLFALTPHVGGLAVTPPVALLAGNLVAFGFGQRRQIRLTYVGRRQLTPSSQELVFTSAAPLRFAAGQYMELTLPHQSQDSRGARRVFSLASAPGKDDIRFGVKIPVSPSSFKRQLSALTAGQIVRATSVAGDFILPRDVHRPVVLIAGGIGVTPFISQLRSNQGERDIRLVYAVSHPDEIAYRSELIAAGIPVTIVCEEAISDLPAGWLHVQASVVTAKLWEEVFADRSSHQVIYISGPPSMVDTVKRALRSIGVRTIKTDYFTGY